MTMATPVPGSRSLEQLADLLRRQRHHRPPLDPGEPDPDGGVGDNQLVVDRTGEGGTDVLSDDADGVGCEHLPELGDERLNVALADAVDGPIAEVIDGVAELLGRRLA